MKSPSSNASSSDAFLSSPDGDRNITLIGRRFNFANKSLYAYLPDYDPAHVFTTQIYEKSYIELPEASGIAVAEKDGGAAVEYYNMQGMKVGKPEKGVYIRRQGTSSSKVIIR